jgi:hypothetical protein
MQYVITDHAVKRFIRRVKPGIEYAKAQELLTLYAPYSSVLRARTEKGQEQRTISADGIKCTLVCKKESIWSAKEKRMVRQTVVVTVLGPDETMTFGDMDLAEEFARYCEDHAYGAALRRTRDKFGEGEQKELSPTTEVKAYIRAVVREELDNRLDLFIGKEEQRNRAKRSA